MYFNKRMRIHARKGFTLVELLTVVGVLSFLMVGLGVIFSDSGSSTSGLKNARLMVGSLINTARMHATLKGTRTRVIIYNDSEDASKQGKRLRYMGAVFLDETSGNWLPINQGITLPEKIYFVPPGVSATDQSGNTMFASKVYGASSGSIEEATFNYPNFSSNFGSGSPEEDYLYLEFSPRGTTANGNSTLVFSVGGIGPTTVTEEATGSANEFIESLTFDNYLHSTAVVLLPNGSVAYLEDLSGVTAR
ncbi:MAG: Tfp pilus assembly protein FimT/FimU [Opitutales bacterium]